MKHCWLPSLRTHTVCGILLIRQIMLKMHENFVKSDSYKNGKDSDMI